jgi:hypothetical protein
MEAPAEIPTTAYAEPYISADHLFSNAYANRSNVPEQVSMDASFAAEDLLISDTVLGEDNVVAISNYNDTMSGAGSEFYKGVVYLYCNALDAGEDCRRVIDTLFHFQNEIGVIDSWSQLGELSLEQPSSEGLSAKLQSAIVRIAKIVIKEELDYNLRGIIPVYDIETMSPSWRIVDLLTAIYFALFYMRPGTELYRKCSNPNCDRYFLVKTTSTKQKYCDSACANATAQRNHRRKVKERLNK